MAIDNDVPRPGSEEAAKLGCRCPVTDNCRGRGIMSLGKAWVVSGDCKVHNIGFLVNKFGEERMPAEVRAKVLPKNFAGDMATYQVISVKGGKYHKPKDPTQSRMTWFSSMYTVCGGIVEPLNVFLDLPDALKYTGGRKQYLCKHCFKAELQAKDD